MKKFIYVASIALLSCGLSMAQSTSQGTSPTPPGDTRDKYGDTVAPDGSTTPRGANTPGARPNDSQPSSMGASTSDKSDTQGTSPTPEGDRRDKYGDTVAPDGSTTPKGANTPGSSTQPQTAQPDMK